MSHVRRRTGDKARHLPASVTAFAFLLFAALYVSTPPSHADHKAKQEYIVGFPEDNMSNDWRAAQARKLAQEFEKYKNVKFYLSDAQGSIAKNINDIEKMVERGADLLFLGPRDGKSLTPIVANLRAKGVHVIFLTRRTESDLFDTFISPSDFEIAKSAAEYLANYLNGKGRILMLEGVPTTTTAMKRSEGFRAGLKNFPEIKIAEVVTGNYSRNGGLRALHQVLQAGTPFDAIFSHNDAMLVGARIALSAAGIPPATIPSIGIDYIKEAREAIRDGSQLASFTYPTCEKEGAQAAMDILNGNIVPKYIQVPARIITKETVEDVEPIF